MNQKIKNILDTIYNQLAKTWFFVASLLLFVLHAGWLALSSNLLPYDEYFHIGIIKYYSHQWSPFINHQPYELSYFGDLTRLPSYMYHYLMSFPYRFFHMFTQNETSLIVLLRFINIGLIVGGVLLFRRLFTNHGMSKRLVNVVCFFFLLTPFLVMLAAENNYDNLMFFCTPICIAYALRLVNKSELKLTDLLLFLSVGLFTLLVKHSFIVVFGALGVYVLWDLFKKRDKVVGEIKADIKKTSKILLIISSVLFLVTSSLFIERHGVNLVRYHQLDVGCHKVQPIEICQNYSPWNRNQQQRKAIFVEELYGNPFSFAQHWGATIMAGLYPIFLQVPHPIGSIDDPFGDYAFKPRLQPLLGTGYVVLAAGIVSLVLKRKEVAKNRLLSMQVFVTSVLVITLFVFNYRTYLNLGRAFAVQARYFLPIIIPFLVVLAFSLSRLIKNSNLKKFILPIAILTYLVFGGAIGWIIRADTNWYWHNQRVIEVNERAKSVLKKGITN